METCFVALALSTCSTGTLHAYDSTEGGSGSNRFSIDGQVEIAVNSVRNASLDSTSRGDKSAIEGEFELGAHIELNREYSAYLRVNTFLNSTVLNDDNSNTVGTGVERGEMWLEYSPSKIKLDWFRIGRQKYKETREWWWDERLDSVGIEASGNTWNIGFAIAKELAEVSADDDGIDPEEDGIVRVLGSSEWNIRNGVHLDGFLLYQHDTSETYQVGRHVNSSNIDYADADLLWAGFRMSGETGQHAASWKLDYRLDAAFVHGDETQYQFDTPVGKAARVMSKQSRDVRGWAMDGQIRLSSSRHPGHSTYIGYAWASGDDETGSHKDRAFRQTGLHDNDDDFHYYGELLRPDLSNLSILSLGATIQIFDQLSLDLVYHKYRQVTSSARTTDWNLNARTTGLSKEIGGEFDFIFLSEPWADMELEFVGSVFRSGKAFGALENETSYGLGGKITYNF